MQKLPLADTRKKKKQKKKKRGSLQAGVEGCYPEAQTDSVIYPDLSSQKCSKSTNKICNSKLPSMGMSVIRQQSQQSYSTSHSQSQALPTSTKSEKKIFVHTSRHARHGRRRRRHKSSEEEPHETTPSISPSSSTGKINDRPYECDEHLDDNFSGNIYGNLLLFVSIIFLNFQLILFNHVGVRVFTYLL